MLKKYFAQLKPYLRWILLGTTVAFLLHTLKLHWQSVLSLRIVPLGSSYLVLALGTTLLAHIWSGWVWGWILQGFQQPISSTWSTLTYLKTNLGKYLPGNVWHFYGRIRALQQQRVPTGIAIFGVVIEPLLMVAAALTLGLLNAHLNWWLPLVCLVALLTMLHPRCLNPVLLWLGKHKAKTNHFHLPDTANPLQRYPLKPFLGEIGFLLLRGVGFLLTMKALTSISVEQVPVIISGFSTAWLLGLIVPGAPGGLGVFEVAAVSLLQGEFSTSLILGAVALYRLVSTLAEAIGAGLAVLDEQGNRRASELVAPLSTTTTRSKVLSAIPLEKNVR